MSTARIKQHGVLIKRISLILLMVYSFMTVGCAKLFIGEDALNINPIEDPAVNITNFTESLACMDELLLQYDIPLLVLTAQDIPNMAGEGSLAGSKDMLITSLSKMSERSGKIRFVSYGTDLKDILLVHRTHEMKSAFQAPDFFIRGSISQHDKGVVANRIGGAIRHDDWNAALSSGHALSFVSLDLNMGLISNLQMLPGITSNNILAVTDRGFGTEYGGRIESSGVFFDFGVDRRDGIGQAIRNLVDLGAIELVGKLAGVPYLSCLPMDFDAAPVVAKIRKEYQAFRHKGNLIRTVQAKLKQYNYYQGDINGEYNRDTRLAIEYFRRLYGVPYHRHPADIDFALYKSIVYGDTYDWEGDRLAERMDVYSFDQSTLIASELIKPQKDMMLKKSYDANYQEIAHSYKHRQKKTPPVAYHENRRANLIKQQVAQQPAQRIQHRPQPTQYTREGYRSNTIGKRSLDTNQTVTATPSPSNRNYHSSLKINPAPVKRATTERRNRRPETVVRESTGSSPFQIYDDIPTESASSTTTARKHRSQPYPTSGTSASAPDSTSTQPYILPAPPKQASASKRRRMTNAPSTRISRPVIRPTTTGSQQASQSERRVTRSSRPNVIENGAAVQRGSYYGDQAQPAVTWWENDASGHAIQE